jgi:hypothetical protein
MSKETLEQALEAFTIVRFCVPPAQRPTIERAITAVIEALAKQEQGEPVAWMKPDALCDRSCMYVCTEGFTKFPECATKNEWVGLSEEQKRQLNESLNLQCRYPIIDAIEAQCKGNNT